MEPRVPVRRSGWYYFRPSTLPFWGIHVGTVVGLVMVGFSWSGLLLAGALYYARMFFITGGYHRYFSHRTYKTSRWFQFLLALGGSTAAQKGVLWWAGNHRHHHKYSDLPGDVHSPRQSGFFYSHVGWIVSTDWDETDYEAMKDMARFPELRWINRWNMLPPALLALGLYLGWGSWGLVYGFGLSTVLLWHGTFTINSLSHVFGRRRYQTNDDSTNNWILALVTMGEGWHNNHHHYMNSCNQGFRWYELDMSYLILKGLSVFGIVWDIKTAPPHIVANEPKRELNPRPARVTLPEAA